MLLGLPNRLEKRNRTDIPHAMAVHVARNGQFLRSVCGFGIAARVGIPHGQIRNGIIAVRSIVGDVVVVIGHKVDENVFAIP